MPFSRKVDLYRRQLDAGKRAQPDFLIIGAQKAGTTSLFKYLLQHPQVVPPFKKEVHFFSNKYRKGLRFYRAHFPRQQDMADHQLTGEASPDYSFHPLAANRIQATLHHPRLILLLRDPAYRALAHYYHMVRRGYEDRSLEEALASAPGPIHAYQHREQQAILTDRHRSRRFLRYAYLQRGFYLEQIRRYHEHFGKASLLITDSQSLRQNPLRVLQQVFDFLGMDSTFTPGNLRTYNQGHYTSPDLAMVQQLQTFYQPHNQALFEYLGRSFDWG